MQVNAARYEGGKLILETPDARESLRFCYQFAPGAFEIVKAKKKRSLDANAYCWVLIHKLSAALGYPPDDIYRDAIKNIGGVAEVACVMEDAAQRICDGWVRNGKGWQTETMPSKIEGCVNVVLYYGSSSYDTKQMSQLIDHIIQDCKALEIETLPPYKISALLEEWSA